MIRSYLIYPIQFIFLLMIQVLILNNIQYSGYINPYLYIIFIFWLPFDTPKWLLMTLSFILGISVDVFSNTLGMHASASVFLAFVRPYVARILAPRDGYDVNHLPSIQDLGFGWFLRYAIILILTHHLFLFFVEVFRFIDAFNTLLRVISSSLFTLILVLITEYFRVNLEKKR